MHAFHLQRMPPPVQIDHRRDDPIQCRVAMVVEVQAACVHILGGMGAGRFAFDITLHCIDPRLALDVTLDRLISHFSCASVLNVWIMLGRC